MSADNLPVLVGRAAVSAAGPRFEDLWQAACEGKDGLRVEGPTPYDTEGFRGSRACWLQPSLRERLLKDTGPLLPVSRLLIDVAQQAISDATNRSLADLGADRSRWGIWLGTSLGGIGTWADQHAEVVLAPKDAPARVVDTGMGYSAPARDLARALGVGGPVATVTTACCSATVATGQAADALRRGEVDVALVCGVDLLSRFVHAGFEILGALSEDDQRPFSEQRDGLWLGEGAAVAIFVRNASCSGGTHGQDRVAVAGSGLAGDALRLTGPDMEGGGLLRSVHQALSQAGLQASDLSAISAHGTATELNDAMEMAAFSTLLEGRVSDVPVHGIKPILGHTLGASGLFELLVLERAMREGLFPGTPGEGPDDPACRLWVHRGEPLSSDLPVCLSTNSAFAGNNAALVLRRLG
ncbi:MAG TPA: hypothetical protein DIU15_12285 [Deltaproteobacteria bacterium]|nr:hypothetical protein [Deltaproteobacteria bacterium]HCP46815.1 hypothetical protein [Deltaproteobacteria bacterium]